MLEITESTLVTDIDTASAHIRSLRDLGVRISIDDFGTGCSSLACLLEAYLGTQTLLTPTSYRP